MAASSPSQFPAELLLEQSKSDAEELLEFRLYSLPSCACRHEIHYNIQSDHFSLSPHVYNSQLEQSVDEDGKNRTTLICGMCKCKIMCPHYGRLVEKEVREILPYSPCYHCPKCNVAFCSSTKYSHSNFVTVRGKNQNLACPAHNIIIMFTQLPYCNVCEKGCGHWI